MVTGAVHATAKLSQPIEVPTKAACRLMGAAITVAGLATIHALRKVRPSAYHRGPVAVATSSSGVTPGHARPPKRSTESEPWS
jgi:hypothetical protein